MKFPVLPDIPTQRAVNKEKIRARESIAPMKFNSLALALIGLIACAVSGCAARQPGQEYPWVSESETRSMDGVTETTMGIGRKF